MPVHTPAPLQTWLVTVPLLQVDGPQLTPATVLLCWQVPLTQVAVTHTEVLEQVDPQVPQLFGSVAVLTQVPLHRVWPDGQDATHMPLLQVIPVGQVSMTPSQLWSSPSQ
jgi:hypothetical protein